MQRVMANHQMHFSLSPKQETEILSLKLYENRVHILNSFFPKFLILQSQIIIKIGNKIEIS